MSPLAIAKGKRLITLGTSKNRHIGLALGSQAQVGNSYESCENILAIASKVPNARIREIAGKFTTSESLINISSACLKRTSSEIAPIHQRLIAIIIDRSSSGSKRSQDSNIIRKQIDQEIFPISCISRRRAAGWKLRF